MTILGGESFWKAWPQRLNKQEAKGLVLVGLSNPSHDIEHYVPRCWKESFWWEAQEKQH